jgi:hypothetical protein
MHQNDDPDNPLLVCSNSWGRGLFDNSSDADADSPSMTLAARNLVSAGITILAASGNDGFAGQGISFPAAMSDVISVGAVYDTTGEVTEYSNTAENLDILAPADPVYTTDIVGVDGYTTGDYAPAFNGTSSACPFAAGAVAAIQSAAMKDAGKYLTPEEVRLLLISTGEPVTDTKVEITKPLVNVGAAVTGFEVHVPVFVGEGTSLNGEIITGWDYATYEWDPNSYILRSDPLFIGNYYLSQYDAGQIIQSPCVDMGSAFASEVGLDMYTTRTNSLPDDDDGAEPNSMVVDMGYHRMVFDVPEYKLLVITTDVDELDPMEIALEANDSDVTAVEGGYYTTTQDQYTTVRVEVVGGAPEGYQILWNGTDDDEIDGSVNYVTLSEDMNVQVVFVRQYHLTVNLLGVDEIIGEDIGEIVLDEYYNRDAIAELDLLAMLPEGYEAKDLNVYQVRWLGTDNDYAITATNTVTMSDFEVAVTVQYELKKTKYYGVVVGISDYVGYGNDLNYADDDAVGFSEELINAENWEEGNIQVLVNSYATKVNIQSAIEEMAQRIDDDDVFVFYFSGRGTTGEDVEPIDEIDGVDEFLVTYVDDISDDELGDWLSVENLHTEDSLVFIDASYSNGNAASSSVRSKGVGSLAPASGDGFDADLADSGVGAVLSACDEGQLAWENSTLRHGVFTYYLLEAMAGGVEQDFLLNNGVVGEKISVEECSEYIRPRVKRWIEANKVEFLPLTEVSQTVTLYDADKDVDFAFLSTTGSSNGEPKIINVTGGITIQDAIRMANEGDIIKVPVGVHEVSGIYVDKGVMITGENPDDPEIVAETILHSFGLALIFDGNSGEKAGINGVTIADGGRNFLDGKDGETGEAPTETDPGTPGHIDGYDGYGVEGGGIYCMPGSRPTIKNCIIENCNIKGGDGGNGAQSDVPVLRNGRGGWGGFARGGGIYIGEGASPVVKNTIIRNCSVTGGSGGNGAHATPETEVEGVGTYTILPGFGGSWSHSIYAPWQSMGYDGPHTQYTGLGGGVYCATNSTPTFINCTIIGNRSLGGLSGLGGDHLVGNTRYPQDFFELPSYGGGVYCATGSHAIFEGCTIEGNYASREMVSGEILYFDYDTSPAGNSRADAEVIDVYVGHGGGLAMAKGAVVEFDNFVSQEGETVAMRIAGNEADRGGGVYWIEAYADFYGCVIADNKAFHGAGVFGDKGESNIRRCDIRGNLAGSLEEASAPVPDGGAEGDPEPVDEASQIGRGGGVYFSSVSGGIYDSTVMNNIATISGGGILLTDPVSEPTEVKNCLFTGNEAYRDGGAVSINWYAKPIITNCTFVGNLAAKKDITIEAGDPAAGEPDKADTEVVAGGLGGAVYCAYHSDTIIRDSILWDNEAWTSLGGYGGQVFVGTGFEFDPRPSTMEISFSLIEGARQPAGVYVDYGSELIWNGDSIFNLDPQFATGDLGDYYLNFDIEENPVLSPAINEGSDSASEVELTRGYSTRTDNRSDTSSVDMGYHYPMVFTSVCGSCDIAPAGTTDPDTGVVYASGNGKIDLEDFAVMTSKWMFESPCVGDDWCLGADITTDSFVDFDDLYIMMQCWLKEDDQTPSYDTKVSYDIAPQLIWDEDPNSTSTGPTYELWMSVKPVSDDWTGDMVEYYFCSDENPFFDIDYDDSILGGDVAGTWMDPIYYDAENWRTEAWYADNDVDDFTATGKADFPTRSYVVRARERRVRAEETEVPETYYNVTKASMTMGAQFGMEYYAPEPGAWQEEELDDITGLVVVPDGRPVQANDYVVMMTAAISLDYDIDGELHAGQVQYRFTRRESGKADNVQSGWQYSREWTDNEEPALELGKTYEYTVETRDMPYENLSGSSVVAYVTITAPDLSPPVSSAVDGLPFIASGQRWTGPGGGSNNLYDYVYADVATDLEGNGVWYQFRVNGSVQAWQRAENITFFIGPNIGSYIYEVRYKDDAGNGKDSAWSAPEALSPARPGF